MKDDVNGSCQLAEGAGRQAQIRLGEIAGHPHHAVHGQAAEFVALGGVRDALQRVCGAARPDRQWTCAVVAVSSSRSR